MRIFFVVPDYFERRPKACMNGLGSIFLTVTPDGTALPCHAARMLPGSRRFRTSRARASRTSGTSPSGFTHFRGDAWMKEPCRSCPEKTRDFGGCRCQAYLLTGDAANADPVCDLSPHHHWWSTRSLAPRSNSGEKPLVFRSPANSSTLFLTRLRAADHRVVSSPRWSPRRPSVSGWHRARSPPCARIATGFPASSRGESRLPSSSAPPTTPWRACAWGDGRRCSTRSSSWG